MACIHRLLAAAGYVLARIFVSAVNNAISKTGSCPDTFYTRPCQDRSFAFFLSPFPILKNTSSSVSFDVLPYDDD